MESFLPFGSSFGIASPWIILGLPLGAALLIYAYLQRGRGKPVVVASVMILRLLEKAQVARRHFIPPLRFFLELLLLTLLIAAAAGLYRIGGDERTVVLIDNSFSMSASEPGSLAGQNILSAAIKQAGDKIAALPGGSLVNLYRSSPKLESLSAGFVPAGSAVRHLSEIEIAFAPDEIDSSIAKLAEQEGVDRILVFTDKQKEVNSQAGKVEDSRIQIYALKNQTLTLANLAIDDIRLYKDALKSSASNISIAIANFSGAAQNAEIELEMMNEPDDPKELRVIRKQSVSLKAQGREQVTFENVPNLPIYKARLVLAANASKQRVDALSEDNQAWLVSKGRKQEVVLVGPEDPKKLGLARLKAVAFSYLTPQEFGEENYRALPPSAVLIFHNVAPRALPPLNAIFITPPQGDAIFRSSKALNSGPSSIAVTSWAEAHPVTTYLNLPSLSISRLALLTTPGWGSALISTTAGTAAVAGEVAGHRYLAYGFDLFPFRGRDDPLRSVLMINSIKWLTDSVSGGNFELTFVPVPLPNGLTSLKDESAKELLPAKSAAKEPFQFKKPGLYLLSENGKRPYAMAVNFFSAAESNLDNPGIIHVPHVPKKELSQHGSNLAQRLVSLALILLLLDLLFVPQLLSLLRRRQRT